MYATMRDLLTCQQTMPGVKGKIESVLARLGRFGVEQGSAVGDEGEFKRRTTLFEWVQFIDCERAFMLTPPQSI